MEKENRIKGILTTFYREAREGDYMIALTKAIYELSNETDKPKQAIEVKWVEENPEEEEHMAKKYYYKINHRNNTENP